MQATLHWPHASGGPHAFEHRGGGVGDGAELLADGLIGGRGSGGRAARFGVDGDAERQRGGEPRRECGGERPGQRSRDAVVLAVPAAAAVGAGAGGRARGRDAAVAVALLHRQLVRHAGCVSSTQHARQSTQQPSCQRRMHAVTCPHRALGGWAVAVAAIGQACGGYGGSRWHQHSRMHADIGAFAVPPRDGGYEAILFVHGFNCSIEGALRLLGQLVALGGFPGHIMPVVFGWPCTVSIFYPQARPHPVPQPLHHPALVIVYDMHDMHPLYIAACLGLRLV